MQQLPFDTEDISHFYLVFNQSEQQFLIELKNGQTYRLSVGNNKQQLMKHDNLQNKNDIGQQQTEKYLRAQQITQPNIKQEQRVYNYDFKMNQATIISKQEESWFQSLTGEFLNCLKRGKQAVEQFLKKYFTLDNAWKFIKFLIGYGILEPCAQAALSALGLDFVKIFS